MSGRTAAESRLAASRERMRLALLAATPKRGESGAGIDWLAGLQSIPGVGVVIAALRSWWAQHPMRATAMLSAEAAQAVLQPLAQRHPLALVLLAAAAGAALARTRPWRWVMQPALLAGLMPQIVGKVLAEVPVQAWLEALASFGQRAAAPAGPSQAKPQDSARPTDAPARDGGAQAGAP